MNIDGVEVKIQKWWIHEVLDRRTHPPYNIPIDRLFLVIYSERNMEGDTYLETDFGKLKVFFSNSIEQGKTFILDLAKYPYPRKGNKLEGLPQGFNKNGDLLN